MLLTLTIIRAPSRVRDKSITKAQIDRNGGKPVTFASCLKILTVIISKR